VRTNVQGAGTRGLVVLASHKTLVTCTQEQIDTRTDRRNSAENSILIL
jgi:hypothetical protein